jgi:peptidoglycan/LPS O-acetylase OafA/YrhL
MNTNIKHIKPLTSLRGIAALSVVVHHFAYYGLPNIGKVLSEYTAFFYNSYLWVDFFFMMSGFIMSHVYFSSFSSGISSHKYGGYLLSRFARIYPLHIFVLILFIGLEISKIFLTNTVPFTGKFNLTALFANIFMLQAFALDCPPLFWCNTYWNEPAWSISVEFMIYGIFPFILFHMIKSQRKSDFFVYIASLILLLLVTLTRGNLDTIIGIPAIARCGLECIIGIITYKIYRQGDYQKYWNNNSLAIIAALWILMILNFSWGDSRWIRSIHDWIILPAFSIMILSLSGKNNGLFAKSLSSNLFIYLGKISYSTYMIHWFLQELIKLFWKFNFHAEFGSNFQIHDLFISLGTFMIVVLLIASLTYKFIEIPMRNSLKSGLLAT